MNYGEVLMYQEYEEKERERQRSIRETKERENIEKYGMVDPTISIHMYLPHLKKEKALDILEKAKEKINSFYSHNKYKL